MISPLVFALIAELTTFEIFFGSAPISSSISMQWDATRAAADAIAVEVLEDACWWADGISGDAVEAAIAATAAATPATETAACN